MKYPRWLLKKESAEPILHLTRNSVSGLVVKSIVAIDGPRVRFAADAFFFFFFVGVNYIACDALYVMSSFTERVDASPSPVFLGQCKLTFCWVSLKGLLVCDHMTGDGGPLSGRKCRWNEKIQSRI